MFSGSSVYRDRRRWGEAGRVFLAACFTFSDVIIGSRNISMCLFLCVQLMSACVLGVAVWIRDSLNTVLTLTAHTR